MNEATIDAFFELFTSTGERDRAIGKAVSLVRAVMGPGGPWKELGIFSSDDPGDPAKLYFLHAMPVFDLKPKMSLTAPDAFVNPIKMCNRAIVMLGGENDFFLTTATLRKAEDGTWNVIRVGRSHFVEAFERLNALLESNEPIPVGGGRRIEPASQLALLPLATLRMPDRRRYMLVMEVMGELRRDVPLLFFPVYDEPGSGFEPLTLEGLEESLR